MCCFPVIQPEFHDEIGGRDDNIDVDGSSAPPKYIRLNKPKMVELWTKDKWSMFSHISYFWKII